MRTAPALALCCSQMQPLPSTRRLSDRYLLLEPIGRGGVGEVYKGWQQALERPVAIKLLRAELTRNSAVVARFEQEARAASRLNHPNVVTVYDVGEAEDGTRFLVMELLEGETLAALIARKGSLPAEVALAIGRQIARGMGAGQGVGLVHRDLKPENIFLVGGRKVKILDFGLATLLEPGERTPTPSDPRLSRANGLPDDPRETFSLDGPVAPALLRDSGRLTLPGARMGTPRYTSPEQALGWEADHRSDLYGFGCILFEMLTGRTPFLGPSSADYLHQHIHVQPPSVTDVTPTVARPIARVVDRLLSKSPSARFADWASVSEALRRIDSPDAAEPAAAANADEGVRPSEPYRFLNPFTYNTRSIFFGREGDARRFRALWEDPDRPPLLFLIGASGVGKSSFIGARLLPGMRDTGHKVLRVVASARPLDAVATAASRELSRMNEGLPRGAGLTEILDRLAQVSGRPVAVLIDQLEELFTLGDAADAVAFQFGLASVATGGDGRIRFVLSLREEFLGALLRTLHPMPLDELARTFPLPPLGPDDLAEALEGPGAEGLPVSYAPFTFEPGLVSEIVNDLVSDAYGEVAPRVQAIGARLWAMVRDEPQPVITRQHYRERLGGSRGILARILDEAISDLEARDRGVAKEILRALTHLPGSPTSRPAPESALVGHAADRERRTNVLRRLESRWRVLQGYTDPRWPEERTFRIAHEALVARIQQYGEEGTSQNRARQLFHHGFSLWMQGGQRDDDLLSEQHFAEVQGAIEDLVLRSPEERAFYTACLRVNAEAWTRRVEEERTARIRRVLQFALSPALLLGAGVLLGQAPVDFQSLRALRLRANSALHIEGGSFSGERFLGADLAGLNLTGSSLAGADLRGSKLIGTVLTGGSLRKAQLESADLSGADLRGADLTGAGLWGARLVATDLSGANVDAWREGADFSGAIFDLKTRWGEGGPPQGALGPGGHADGVQASEIDLTGADLTGLSATGASMTRTHLDRATLDLAVLDRADLAGASLRGATLTETSLTEARLVGADLGDARLERAELSGADLERANLCGADLSASLGLDQASLKGAVGDARTRLPPSVDPAERGMILLSTAGSGFGLQLSGANLRGAVAPGLTLRSADLSAADLRDVDLRGADLENANLAAANLERANLAGARLCGADLSGAELSEAHFEGAISCEATRWPADRPPQGLAP